MFKISLALLAGLCTVSAVMAQDAAIDRVDRHVTSDVDSFRDGVEKEHWRDGDGIGEHERNAVKGRTVAAETERVVDSGPVVAGTSDRIESRTEIRGEDRIDRTNRIDTSERVVASSGDKADRSGPVPFADIGHVGGEGDTLTTAKAEAQDERLQVRGEIIGDELVLHLPAGTVKDTISLRSSDGLHLSRADVKRLGRIKGDDIRLKLADINLKDDGDLGNLWVWGTGPESASLLQRVAMSGNTARTVAQSEDVPRRGASIGTGALGAPMAPQRVNEPNMLDDQVEKENEMLRQSGLEKSTEERQIDF